jgi:hypothetical protein
MRQAGILTIFVALVALIGVLMMDMPEGNEAFNLPLGPRMMLTQLDQLMVAAGLLIAGLALMGLAHLAGKRRASSSA